MRLKHIHIGNYKNLKDFSLDFDGDSFIDVFVGKNGTGKSNLFEALIEIFRHLFEDDHKVDFDFTLKYELEETEYFIKWQWAQEKWLDEVGNEANKISKDKLPDNILIYYSGHNDKITELVKQYEQKFKKTLKQANQGDTRKFIGIGKEYKALLLTVLLLQPNDCKARQFIIEKLGIKSISDELEIRLQRPDYAKQNGYDVDRFDDATRYWKAQGITQTFLDKVGTVKKANDDLVRDKGYITPKKTKYDDEYIRYFEIADFQSKFEDTSSQELFRSFDNLKTIDMLKDISIEIELKDGTKIDVDQFSDGQFQSVYIYSIIELFKDRNCLTLLDEPDSFLHPEWQFDFLKQVFEITDVDAVNNHVLMTSHSAITLIPHDKRNVNLFKFEGNDLKCRQVNKKYAIEQLSAQMIKYTETEQIISIIHTINAEDKPILFTEGSTDPLILKEAWNKLYEEPIPFNIIFAFGCIYLRMLLQDQRILNELNGNPMFGLFDFDEAYNQWDSIDEEGDNLIETDPYKGLIKKVKQKNSYAMMLPIPKIDIIENQVIKDKAAKKTFCGESEMEIEHLFYGDSQTHEFFEEIPVAGGGKILDFLDTRKSNFAKNVVPEIDKEHFEVFRPMFEFIKSKI